MRIFYEGRIVPLDISDEELVAETEKLLQQEDEAAAGKLVSAETKLDRVVGSEARLDKVADDIARHFTEREKLLSGKAMVVGMSREICVELTERLKEKLGDEAVTCVITAQATEPKLNRYRRSKAEMKQVAADFKDPDHPLKVVVVRDMWLTGFDVPALHTMYIDKPMRDHGLLQAIARVNRVFRDKPGGLVVDYIGIGEDLRKALPRYAAKDVEDAMVPVRQVISKLREKHEILCEFFHGLEWRGRGELSATARATLLAQAHAKVVEDDEQTKRFLAEQSAFARLLALVNPDPVVEQFLERCRVLRRGRGLRPQVHAARGRAERGGAPSGQAGLLRGPCGRRGRRCSRPLRRRAARGLDPLRRVPRRPSEERWPSHRSRLPS